ncbi:hypothetical protein Tco_1211037 [Tanacetum coccineum]
MFEDDSYKANNVHKDLYEALQKSLELDYSNQHLANQEEACKKRRKRRDAPRSPPGSPPSQPPPPASASGAPGTSGASGSSQLPPPLPPPSTDDLMHDDSAPDEQVQVSDDQDSGNDHTLAAADSRKDWWKPLPKEERPVTLEPSWTIPSSHNSKRRSVTRCSQIGLTGRIRKEINKGSCPALSISKMKVVSYPDFGLELLVLEQMWIDDVCTYNASAKFGFFHWWFTRQKFYIDKHDSSSRRKEVRTHMRILSVVRIKAYSRYKYDYLSEIVLRRADHKEHKIAEKDFKNLYHSDFEDLNLLL